ncbi:glucosidase II beta subunit-like protein, partial [Dinothrombium tinctorium]
IPGVKTNFAALYAKRGEHFKCLISGEIIAYKQVNDDYCDCVDGSDEPSTNACENNAYYCKIRSFSGKDKIESSKVNDGICDCCDGSDEWLNHTLPFKLNAANLQAMKSSKIQVYFTPCINRC